ncbi:hypothetical protein [Hydrogenophaga sp.]|jgi:hypothetical protein|uniref:hypothetical protein n=1 Tax=Hydrogenophaga sp. TaxID=1904254 RepID=UPI0025C421C7|nr:hypothetical protein [Hydrogenophaga sp.]
MNILDCPRLGRHCITMRAALNTFDSRPVPTEALIMQTSIDTPTSLHITPLATVLELLASTEKSLGALHCHPVDLTSVGVETASLAQLQLVVVRKEERQRRIDAPDVAHAAAEELDIARQISTRVKPLADNIRQHVTTSESAMKVLLQEHNPTHARKLLLAHLRSPVTILLDHEVLTNGADDDSAGSCTVKGEKSHELVVDVLSTDREKSMLVARLLKVESACELFKNNDVGVQTLQLSVHDQDSFFILCQCAALGLAVGVTVSVDVGITLRSFQYRATLLSIKDKSPLVQRLKDQVLAWTEDMFMARVPS